MTTSPALARVEQHVTDYLAANDAVGYNRFLNFDWGQLKDSVHQSGIGDLQDLLVYTQRLQPQH
jgi:hypothetical protein